MEKTLRAVSVILSLFVILFAQTHQVAGADLPEGRDRTLALSNWTDMEENPAPDEGEKNEVIKHLGNLPAFFIENQGQLAGEARYYFKGNDTVYFTDEAVVFQKIGDRRRDRDSKDSALALVKWEDRPEGQPEAAQPALHLSPTRADCRDLSLPLFEKGGISPQESLTYRLEFLGANPTSPIARNELEGKVNYFTGNDPSMWHTNIPTYQEIVYPGLYGSSSRNVAAGFSLRGNKKSAPEADGPESVPARHSEQSEESRPFAGSFVALRTSAQGDTNGLIDLVYKGVPGGMKYEFIVHPGASPDNIRLGYTGIERLSIDDKGNLIIHTALGDVKDERPYAYQEIDGQRVEVSCSFRIQDSGVRIQNTVFKILNSQPQVYGPQFVYGFEVAPYNPSRPLVIDPGLSYSTFLGGSGSDFGNSIALDASGNAYVAGETQSTNFPTTLGAFDTSYYGLDAFVTKLNHTGSALVYSTFLGGTHSGTDAVEGIALDASGNAYVTGLTFGGFPTTPGAFDTWGNGGSDVFVTKLNPTGSALVYSTYIGGSGNESGRGIAVDASGNAYVTGSTWVTIGNPFPTTPGAFDTSYNGDSDPFVTKLNPTGSALVYSTLLGGSISDWGSEIAVDASGNAYVTGQTYSTNFPTTPGAFDTSHNGAGDAFVTKLNHTGSGLVYSTFLGGSGTEHQGPGIAVDASGNAYVTGRTYSSNFPTTPGAFDTSHNGGSDVFVTKLNPTGYGLAYSTFLGGIGWDQGFGIAVDTSGNAYVTGFTGSTVFPTTPGAFDTSHNGGNDAFVTKLNPAGTALVYSTYLGGSSDDVGWDIALDASGNDYVTGWTRSTNFPTTPGAFDTSYNGGGFGDTFVTKLGDTTGVPDLVSDPEGGFANGPVSNPNGRRVTALLKVKNRGNVDARAFKVKIFLSNDSTLDEGDTLKKTFKVKGLHIGATKSLRIRITHSASMRDKYLIGSIDANNEVVESKEDNNLAVGRIQ